jgi:glycerate-2-kinase
VKGGLPDLARRLASLAIAAVDPERLVREELARRSASTGTGFEAVLALGKAAAALARGTRETLAGASVTPRRLLLRPHSAAALLDPGWEQRTGGHPLPDRQSVAAGERLERWLGEIAPGHTLLALVSGGASACVELPAAGLTLEDLIATQRALLASGLPIAAVNTVRKHLSRLKGGGALKATRARVLALLLSDVPGDDPAAIASGPFAPDPGLFADAIAAVSSLAVPDAVRRHLEAGARGELPETLKPGGPDLERLETVVVGGARTAAGAVAGELRRRGFTVIEGELTGEASVAARALVERGRAVESPEAAVVLAGETTVTLAGDSGTGGRNGELALAAARELATGARGVPGVPGEEIVLALATDGEDGGTKSAGAIAGAGTWEAVRRGGLDPDAALAGHDSFPALAKVPGALLQTGATGTNVGDVAVYLRALGASPAARSGMA